MPCGSFFTHLSDWPDYDTEDLVEEVEKVKRGEKKSKKDIKRIAKTILRQTPDMSVYVYRILHDYGFTGLID